MNVDKVALRRTILASRTELSAVTLAAAAVAIRQHLLAAVRSADAEAICAYVPVGAEPGSLMALDELLISGVEVLLPVLRADFDLDWARYEGSASLVSAKRGLREPTGLRLGVDAISAVDVAIVPALAVDGAGHRLGRGGGSYDRALARLVRDVPVAALLHDGERLPAVPYEAHDRLVSHTVTPALGWQPVAARSGRSGSQ